MGDKLFADVVTHIDPIKTDGKLESEIDECIKSLISQWDGLGIQDLRLNYENDNNLSISFEISCSVEFKLEQDVSNTIIKYLKKKYKNAQININFKRQIVESELKEN